MLLAEKGLPSSANAGYELFDKLGSIGLTSFMQEITRVRALEGEIARTIQAMRGVEGCPRAHRAARERLLPPQSPAALGVGHHPHRIGRRLLVRAAIRHLVAAAVPGMTVDQVTVLSTDGTILASGGDGANATPAKMMSLEKTVSARDAGQHRARRSRPISGSTISRSASRRASTPTSGRSTRPTSTRSRASSARCGSSRRSGNPQNSNSQDRRRRRAEHPGRAGDDAARGDQSKRSNERREELTNYEVSSKTISTVSEGYKIDQLTVAVVINRKRLLATLGEGAGQEAHRQAAEGGRAPDRIGSRRRRQARRPHHRGRGRVPAERTAVRAGAGDPASSSSCCASSAASSTPSRSSPSPCC